MDAPRTSRRIKSKRKYRGVVRRLRTPEQREPIKPKKLVCTEALSGVCGSACCSRRCLENLTFAELREHRQEYSLKTETERLQWLLDYVNGHTTENRVRYVLLGKQCCRTAFRKAYGFSLKKLQRACNLRKLQAFTVVHGNKGFPRVKKSMFAVVWLKSYIEFMGDHMPNSNEIFLPIYIRVTDLYRSFIRDTPSDQHVSFHTFCIVWAKHFRHVKIPKNTRLGKCDYCTKLKMRRYKVKCRAEREEVEQEMKEHTELHTKERIEYHTRRQQARIQPDTYMSLIIDNKNAISLPFKKATPKSWMTLKLLKAHITGVINHGMGVRELNFTLDTYPQGPNMSMTVLTNHLIAMVVTSVFFIR